MNKNTLTVPAALGLATLLSAALAPAVCAAEKPSIRALAPESTVIIAGADDVDAALEHLRATPLWDLWKSDEMRQLRAEAEEGFERAMGEMMVELGVDQDELPMPTGGVGFALFAVMNRETGMPGPGMLLSADFGANAAKASELIDAAIEKAEEEEDLEYESRDIRGRTVMSFLIPEPEPDPELELGDEPGEADDMDEWDDMEMDMGIGPAESFMSSIEHVHFVRDEGLFMWSTDLGVLERGLEVSDGEADGGGLDGSADFGALMTQIGENDAYAALIFRNLPSLIAPMDPMGMTMMFTPMLKQMVGEVAGAAVGFRLDAPSAMVDETVAVYMPRGKAGLTSLMTRSTPRDAPPAFVGSNTVSYTSMNFDFAGVPAAIQPIVQMMQMMMAQQMNGADAGPAPGEMIDQLCSTLGRRMHTVQTLDHPIDLEGMKQFTAIECLKPQELEHLLEQFAPQMGMEGRDFLGHRLYTAEIDVFGMLPPGMPGMPGMDEMDMGPTEPPAIGIGAGYVFLGLVSSVEQALRSSGDAEGAGLGEQDAFLRATAVLPGREAVSWGYTDIVEVIEATMSESRRQMELAVAAAGDEAMDFGPEMDWWAGFDVGVFRRFVGPVAWEMTSTDQGFVVKAYVLEAASSDSE